MLVKAGIRADLEQHLREAIAQQGFTVHYHATDQRRWQHDWRGIAAAMAASAARMGVTCRIYSGR